jgi:hypothetical protein
MLCFIHLIEVREQNMIPQMNRDSIMVIGFGGGGTAGLYGYLKKIDASLSLESAIKNIPGVECKDDVFHFKDAEYRIASQSKWETYGGADAGEDLVALCKEDTPLLITRHYSLAYEDSYDDSEYHQGPSGDEVYLFKEDALAMLIYEAAAKH